MSDMVTEATGRRYWHFLPADGRLAHGRRVRVEAGKTYRVEGPLLLCRNGMHGSVRAMDALYYAPGPLVSRVTLGGEVLEGADKACARERSVLWVADATTALHQFACWCAERALLAEIAAGREPARASWEALHAKRRWLAGDLDDAGLAAARAAARSAEAAAEAAAWAAAWAAADAAARSATRSAAAAAARSAVWASAALAPAWLAAEAADATAWVAEGDAQEAALAAALLALGPEGEAGA